MKPLISCIITTHNREQLLHRAIDSILKQTYNNFELIIVNDGSKDNTADILNDYIKKENRIQIINRKQSFGGNYSRNEGIRISSGEFISLLDDDDEFMPEKLDLLYNRIVKNKKIGLVYGGSKLIRRDMTDFNKLPKYGSLGYNNLLQIYCQFSPPACLIRRECFEIAGFFDESLPAYQDWDMWLRISRHYKIDAIKDIVCIVHQEHELPRIGLNDKAILGFKRFREKHIKSIPFLLRIIHNIKNRQIIRQLKLHTL